MEEPESVIGDCGFKRYAWQDSRLW